jgi:hypothetical protein
MAEVLVCGLDAFKAAKLLALTNPQRRRRGII